MIYILSIHLIIQSFVSCNKKLLFSNLSKTYHFKKNMYYFFHISENYAAVQDYCIMTRYGDLKTWTLGITSDFHTIIHKVKMEKSNECGLDASRLSKSLEVSIVVLIKWINYDSFLTVSVCTKRGFYNPANCGLKIKI